MTRSILLTLLLSSLLRFIPSATAQSDGGQRNIYFNIYLSHLSPLITYSPASPADNAAEGWNASLSNYSTTNNNATVKFGYFGENFSVFGNGAKFDWEMTNRGNTDGYVIESSDGRTPYFLATLTDVGLDWHDVSMQTNDRDGSYLDITTFQLTSYLPSTGGYANVQHVTAEQMSNAFFNEDGAWEIMEPPSNQTTTTSVSYGGDQTTLPAAVSSNFTIPFNSTVLSTDQVGKRLMLQVPRRSSLMILYGTVGPDQGEYEVKLGAPIDDFSSIKGFDDVRFHPQPFNQTFSGERAVDANQQVMYVGWLDPRVNYTVQMTLLEDGKRADFHGASFWQYSDPDSNVEIADWWPKSDRGLSGGQIAGIVVGSVVGAALLGLAIWFLVRRNRKNTVESADPPMSKVDSDA